MPYFGRGHATLNWACLCDKDKRVEVSTDDPTWRSNVGWRGDKTVPAVAAIPAELKDQEEVWRAVPDPHGPMGSTPAVLELLTSLLGEKLPGRGNLRPDRPWVGLDLDDVVPAGAETRLGAELFAGEAGGTAGPGTGGAVTLTPSVQAGIGPITLVADGASWRAALPPLPAGLYEVTVEIKGGWYGTSVYASAPLAVVDAESADLVPDEEAGQ